MAPKRKEITNPIPQPPSVNPEKGIELIKKQIDRGKDLLAKRPLRKDDYLSWENITQACLEKSFGLNSPNVNKVLDIGKYGAFPMGASEDYWENSRSEDLSSQISMLISQIELLEMEISLSSDTKSGPVIPSHLPAISRKIFLVHGHDDGIKEATARFLEKLGLAPIILHEKPNQGRTIIEKISDYSDVGFAVVLLTGDDVGRINDAKCENLLPRARQNVVLELGYFLGRIGRQRVCALYQKGVEIPSDYSGVLFIPLDESGAWRVQLAKEIKATGIDLDMNSAI
ncbi:MAG: nucleotide-binding protein [Candidatus Omnitrophota bacterium]